MAQQGALPPPESPPPPPAPPPGDKGGSRGGQQPTLSPVGGEVVRDQYRGAGRFGAFLVARDYSLANARDANNPKQENVPGNTIQILLSDGGAIPGDARISVGDSGFFPLVEGWVYESPVPFRGYSVYWPTAAPGVVLWILTAIGSLSRVDR